MASVTITAGNTDVDWLEVLPADDKPVALRGMVLSQTSRRFTLPSPAPGCDRDQRFGRDNADAATLKRRRRGSGFHL
jgi:hypothetical protein